MSTIRSAHRRLDQAVAVAVRVQTTLTREHPDSGPSDFNSPNL